MALTEAIIFAVAFILIFISQSLLLTRLVKLEKKFDAFKARFIQPAIAPMEEFDPQQLPKKAYPKSPDRKPPIYIDDEAAYRIEQNNKQNHGPML